jgi:preprotein translocase subunit SecA
LNAAATTAVETASAVPDLRPPAPDNRFGARWLNHLRALFGTPSRRRLARAALRIDQIRHWEEELSRLDDAALRRRGLLLRGRARGGELLDRLLPEAFGLVCVAAVRNVKLRPFDVQLAAGAVLHGGALAEVVTGEGKTLIATLPVTLNALLGKGVHVTTTNDYLARRDAEWTGLIYNAVGLSVGVLQGNNTDEERKRAYECDITYGTAAEFGFDFLRDRLKVAGGAGQAMPFWQPWTSGGPLERPLDPRVQRGHHFALVDEADNIFIDEAKTPLIIAMGTRLAEPDEQIVYRWADGLARQMSRDEHFTLDEKKQKIELTDEGKRLARYSSPPAGEHSHAMDKLCEHIERAVHAHYRFRLDQHYMVQDGKVILIDEATGRPMPERHWREGLHQAVEAKEGAPITAASEHAAQITFQRYFRLYDRLAGMSGTAVQNFWELRRVYKLWVVCVPTNRPIRRDQFPDRVFPHEDAKLDAVAEEIIRIRAAGRPVLVGTRSVEKSESLSRRLQAAKVPHQVLNARPENAAREAEIVAQAGRPGTVTIATNMAGRGTDIILGGNPESLAWERLRSKYPSRGAIPPEEWERTVAEIDAGQNLKAQGRQVAAAGGLHVIGTERHEAARIDRQLAGRAGRQGDPGSCQFFLALDDELLEALGPRRQEGLRQRGLRGDDEDCQKFLPYFRKAQRKTERRHYRQRFDLLVYERQRQEILKDLGADPYVD